MATDDHRCLLHQVLRVSLEALVMTTKALRLPHKASDVLSSLPEPPPADAIAAAVRELTALQALDAAEQLTPLGRLLVQLPVEPRLAKLLVLGVAFGAVDETLTIAAALSLRSPFVIPLDAMEARRVAASKERFARGSQSDHLAALHAYQAYFYATPAGVGDRRAELAEARSLSPKVLGEMRALKADLIESLGEAKLLSRRMRSLGAVEARARAQAATSSMAQAAAPSGAAPGGAAAGLGATPELLAALTAVALSPRLAYVADAHGCPRMTSDVIESAIIVH